MLKPFSCSQPQWDQTSSGSVVGLGQNFLHWDEAAPVTHAVKNLKTVMMFMFPLNHWFPWSLDSNRTFKHNMTFRVLLFLSSFYIFTCWFLFLFFKSVLSWLRYFLPLFDRTLRETALRIKPAISASGIRQHGPCSLTTWPPVSPLIFIVSDLFYIISIPP